MDTVKQLTETIRIHIVNIEDQTLLSIQIPVTQCVSAADRNMLTERYTQGHVWVSVFTVECLVVIQKTKCVIAKR